ncbi:MAG: glycosyltransferase family 39 protein [Planctomycetes bacterium]|nr:glycosyltransferase family 39 protein [Planctomycetota bacterium]
MRKPTFIACAVVFVVALVLRVLYVHEHYSVLQLDISQLKQTDNHTFAEWAKDIAAGDILCRNQVHAFHIWTEKVAPEDLWTEWYGSEKAFHQSPFYPYFIAAVYKLVGCDHERVGYVQALFGALTCVLTLILVKRTVSFRAGVIAGLLLALYAGYYIYDAMVLRDGFMAFVTVVLALALERAVTRGRARDWLLAGAALGFFHVAKETGLALLVLTVLLALWRLRARPAAALRVAALLLVGWFVVLSPAVLRNALLEVPLLQLSTRGPEVFVGGNAMGQDGVSWNPPIDVMREILRKSEFSLLKSVYYTLGTHAAAPLGFIGLLWDKIAAFFNGYEPPNNINFDLHRTHLATLRWGFVSMRFLGAAAILGLLLGLQRRRKLAVPYLLFLVLTASVVALYVVDRFRLQVVPLLALFAALSVDWALAALGRKRWLQLAVAVVPFWILWSWCEDTQSFYSDSTKNFAVMLKHVKIGNLEQAKRYRDLHLEIIHKYDYHKYDPSVGWKLKDIEDSFAAFEAAEKLPRDGAEWHLQRGRGFMYLNRVTKRQESEEMSDLALEEYRAALEIDPNIRGAQNGMGELMERMDKTYRALSHYGEELQLHPLEPFALRAAARILYDQEKLVPALCYLERLILLGERDPLALARSASILIDPDLPYTDVTVPPDGPTIASYNPKVAVERARKAAELALQSAEPDCAALKLAARVLYQKAVLHGPLDLIGEGLGLLETVLRIERGEIGAPREIALEPDPDIPKLIEAFRKYLERPSNPVQRPAGRGGKEKPPGAQDPGDG